MRSSKRAHICSSNCRFGSCSIKRACARHRLKARDGSRSRSLEVPRNVLEKMMAKAKAASIGTRDISVHQFIDSIYFPRSQRLCHRADRQLGVVERPRRARASDRAATKVE
jgi:hypothetical protein